MIVNEIIKSLSEKPTEWTVMHSRNPNELHNGKYQLFTDTLNVYTYSSEIDMALSFCDRMRLRWAIWRWKKLRKAKRKIL